MFDFCFFFFSSVHEDGCLSQMTHCLFYVSNAEKWNVFVFLFFLIWFLTFKNQELVFVTVFLTLCSLCSHSSLYHFSFDLAPTFILLILIFSVIKKLNDFGFFLDFRYFFGLQLILFNIRQYWQFARVPFPECPIITFILIFSGLGIVLKRFFAFECFSVAVLWLF